VLGQDFAGVIEDIGSGIWMAAMPTAPDAPLISTRSPCAKSVLLLGPFLNLLRRFKAYVVRVAPHADDLKAIRILVEQGKLKPVVEQVFPLPEIAAAHVRSESRRVVGKLVIDIGE
jgi:NADPH:quinone reductase-like Zn-dependent oxidoreductase